MRSLRDKLFAASTLYKNATATQDVWYIVESANWAIRQVGEAVTSELNRQKLIRAAVTTSPRLLRNSIVHYGSLPTFFSSSGPRVADATTKRILTIFHFSVSRHIPQALQAAPHIHRFHTASRTTASVLQKAGISEERITVIPLGVNLNIFRQIKATDRSSIRQELNIPDDAVVIGSFQKDGVGWQRGLQPKLEKGPDILVDTVTLLAKDYPVHVLLVGPARGYVAAKLQQHGIAFTNIGYVADISKVARYYAALDLYLISSRVEGGPLALLESWATGIPVVTTPVGMAADYAQDGANALSAPITDAKTLAIQAERIIKDPSLAQRLTSQAQSDVQKFAWPAVARRYYEELYAPLLNT